jgi:hypothetical protein
MIAKNIWKKHVRPPALDSVAERRHALASGFNPRKTNIDLTTAAAGRQVVHTVGVHLPSRRDSIEFQTTPPRTEVRGYHMSLLRNFSAVSAKAPRKSPETTGHLPGQPVRGGL